MIIGHTLTKFNKLFKPLLIPIQSCKRSYFPLLMIYFAYGASSFISIADSFFIKERLDFSAAAVMNITVWLSLPWTIKMVFGQLVDSVPVFRSNRLSYITIAATLMAISSILLAGLAAQWHWLTSFATPHSVYLISMLLNVIGVVLQDVVADAMSVEVVDRTDKTDSEIQQELAMVQVLGRISLGSAMFLVAGLGGWLAHHFSYESMYLMTLLVPIISLSGCIISKPHTATLKPINKSILFGGILFGFFVVSMGWLSVPYSQEWIFATSFCIIIFFLRSVTHSMSTKAKERIFKAACVIFIFRAMPSVGPALQWWQIDVLGFNKAFFGTLAQIGAGLSIAGMWLFARTLTKQSIARIFIALTIVLAVFNLPTIGMYYGLHHWTQSTLGFGAHTIALVDTALASPFVQISMIPMLTLVAINAPQGNAATWFALMASLMNLALTAGSLISKWLNLVWGVTREIKDSAGHIVTPANYTHLGGLLWVTFLCGLIMPILSIIFFMRDDLRKSDRNINH